MSRPLVIANAHGWEIGCRSGFTAVWDGERLAAALQLVIVDNRIAQVLIMLNPDKLGGIEEPRAIAR